VGTLFFAWNGLKSIFSITTIEQINQWSIALPKCALALAPLLSIRVRNVRPVGVAMYFRDAAIRPPTDMVTGWSRFRRFGQDLECRRQQVSVPLGLL
jgi:hypothetical protein